MINFSTCGTTIKKVPSITCLEGRLKSNHWKEGRKKKSNQVPYEVGLHVDRNFMWAHIPLL